MNKITLKLFTLTLTILCIAIFTHTTLSTHAQTGGTFNLIGHFGAETNAVFVDGNTAYISMGSELAILDISDPFFSSTPLGKTKGV